MGQVQVSLFSSWCLEYLIPFCLSFLVGVLWRYCFYFYYPPFCFLAQRQMYGLMNLI